MRIVIVCFIGLGLAFYQMSGGKDFVPRSVERQAIADTSPRPEAPPARPVAARPMPKAQIQDTKPPKPVHADASTSAAVAASTGSLFAPPTEQIETQDITLVSLEDNPALFGQPLDSQEDPQPLDISVSPSLGAALSSPVAAAPAPEAIPAAAPQPDIRRVKGDRVNLRGGPGTTFSVLASLTRDTEVEILDNPGDGWVQLQVIEENGATGWIADYLLTK